MKVYLSWSGELGRRTSNVLRTALRELIPNIEVWSPGSDITAGTRWIDEIRYAIEDSKIAVVCFTKESLDSPWLLYELGFMGSRSDVTTVILWLVDVQYSELFDPLTQFQAIRSDSQSFHRLVELICRDQSIRPPQQDLVNHWALEVEAKIRQLVGPTQMSSLARNREGWIAQIEEAANTRNQDQLKKLLQQAEAAQITDRAILLALMRGYFELKDLQGLIDTFERFETIVGHDPEALFRYAWALIRTHQSSRAIKVLENASTEGIYEPEITGLLGRAYKDQWREQANQGDHSRAENSLRNAAATYAEGFKSHPNDVYLGINAVELLHLLGDKDSVSLRDDLMPRVQLAAESGVKEHYDYWGFASLLELAVVRQSQAEALQFAAKLQELTKETWEIETTVQQLRLLSHAEGFGGETPQWIHDLVENLSKTWR